MPNNTITKKRVVRSEGNIKLGNAQVRMHVFKTVDNNSETVKLPFSNVIDPFDQYYGVVEGVSDELRILKPPFDVLVLAQMENISNMLRRCVDVYKTNIDGYGYQLEKADYVKKEEIEPPEFETEKQKLRILFDYCNPDQNITQLRDELTDDKENIGYSCMEIVRNRIGDIAEFYLVPSYSVRITSQDNDFTSYDEKVRNDKGEYITIPRNKRFRRYVQYFGVGQQLFFKEFGDPRPISAKTGQPNENDKQAHEMIMFKNNVTYGNYGIPRYIGSLLGIIGNRKAQEVNLLFFDNKTIPPMIVLVSGGSLTEESLTLLKDQLQSELRGVENFHKTLFLEAVPSSAGVIEGEKMSPVRMDIKPLTQFMQSDATFGEYTKANEVDIREDFRLPPIFVGASDDYTRATAEASIEVAENLVFQPERKKFDDVINRKIFSDMEIKTLNFVTIGSKISNSEDILNALGKNIEALPLGRFYDIVMDALGEERIELDEQIYNTPIAYLPRIAKLFGIEDVTVTNPINENDTTTISIPEDADEENVEKFIELFNRVKDKLNKNVNFNIKKSLQIVEKIIPKSKKDESKKDFIKRFMGNKSMNDEFPDNKQRRAVAESTWDDKDK